MPVRFQVDGDFYDHPKSIGLSDAATALWTRAGSYSANKLTDGFLAEHVLQLLSRTPVESAEELVTRGLWKRVKGGYRFHQWEDRGNLTKARVEAERSSDRQRKRRARQSGGQDANTQVRAEIVQPDSEPDSDRNPPGIRGLSVSVSKSVSKSVAVVKRATQLPASWKPNESHLEIAKEYGLEPAFQLRAFRDHHEAKGTTYKNWDAAFRTWLNKAKSFQSPAYSAPSPVARKHLPEAAPDVDPDDYEAYAAAMRGEVG